MTSKSDESYPVRDWLFRLDAENAHHLASFAARAGQRLGPGVLRSRFEFEDRRLEQWLWNAWFKNPVGLAAGFDKNARLIRFFEQIGFGFVEVGSVSALPSPGNPRPRLFRLPDDQAIINRMGLNNDGARRIAARIRRTRDDVRMPIGVNLAKTHDPAIMGEAAVHDFVESFRRLHTQAEYITLNVSCPNTVEGKTFEDPEALDGLLRAVMEARSEMQSTIPVLIKLSPPATDRVVFDNVIEEIISIAIDHGVHGFVATNTASDRLGLSSDAGRIAAIGRGGLSGPPIEQRATRLVAYLYARTGGRVPIIGVGGVSDGDTAYAKIRAGASLVQLYTALVYKGPALVLQVKKRLLELLDRDGIDQIRDAVGLDTHGIMDTFGRPGAVTIPR